MKHYEVAQFKFKKDEWELEEEGIVKIYRDRITAKHNIYNIPGTDIVYYIQKPNRLSGAQVNWLVDNDFNVDEDDIPL
jgi:hypothetical protein